MTEQDPEIIDADIDDSLRGELVPIDQHRAQVIRTVDMRNAATDSWTDVLESVADLAVKIAGTDFVPSDYRGKPGQVAATVLHGRELGLAPMTALSLTNPIKGKPTLSAEGMRSLVMQAGHSIKVSETSGSRCVMRGRRRGDEEWTTVTWTLDDARQAGLLRKSRSGEPTNWDKYPRAMLLARATTELCRIEFPDVIHGMRSAEELMDELDSVTPYEPPAAPQQTTTVQRKPVKKAAAKKLEPTPEPASHEVPKEEAPTQPPARKRAPLPAKKTSQAGGPEEAATDQAGDIAPESSAGPAVEDQQDEVRRLSEERRQLRGQEKPAAAGPGRNNTEADGTRGADEAEVSTGRDTGPKLTAGQRASIMMHFARLDLANDRDERLLWTNILLGYQPDTVKSANDLRQTEAITLLGKLERFKDREQLDQSLQQDELIPDPDE